MDWQQLVSLVIVAAAAALLAGSKFRRRKFSFERDTHCGCAAGPASASPEFDRVSRAQRGAPRGAGENEVERACVCRTAEIIFSPLNGHVQSQFVRAFRDPLRRRVREGSARAHWVPNTDVYATDNGLVVKVELAGMRSENLEITVEGNRLRISGNRPDGCRAAKCSFLVMEINYGPFESVLEAAARLRSEPGQSSLPEWFLADRCAAGAAARRKAPRCPSPRGITLFSELFQGGGI